MRNRQSAGEWWAVFAILLAFGFFINRNIEMKGLYMDDLYLWSCYGEQSFWEYVFPVGGTRFRFIFYLISYVLLGLIGTHVTWIVPINIVLNVLVAFTIYLIGKKVGGGRIVPVFCGILYLLSRMAYYQIGQLYGMMETFALWGALGIFYGLYVYLNEEREWGLKLSLILYFLTCFVHERYMVLIVVIFLALAMKLERRIMLWGLAVLDFLMVMAIRMATIGTLSPAGTAGTDVADTFHVGEAFRFAVSQVLYVFGVNAGPEHLNGMRYADSPGSVRALVVVSACLLAVMIALFFFKLLAEPAGRGLRLKNLALFFVFIAMCIGCSSVTIRVEMRWVYVSYAMALLFICYMAGQWDAPGGAGRSGMSSGLLWPVLVFGYLLLMLPTETFYRAQYPNIYLWPNQLRYNSLAGETYGIYGDAIFGKHIYIIGDSYEMSDFTRDTFFKVYDQNRRAEGLEVTIVDDIRAFGQVTVDMLVLTEVPEQNAFKVITAFVRNLKCEITSGYYRDGWMDQKAAIRVMAGGTGKIVLDCYYPGALTGDETITVTSGGEELAELSLTAASQVFTLEAEPYQWIPLEFETNFYTEDADEQRGTEKMALIVHIRAD